MNNQNKFMVIGLLSLMIFVTIAPTVLAVPPETRAENREGSIFIETPELKVKLLSGRPDIFFWVANDTESRRYNPVFHISFTHISEVFGDDLVLDNRQELGGKTYNLGSDQIEWTLLVEEDTNHIQATLTSSPIANGATIIFVYHIYLEETIITADLDGTTVSYDAKALSEIKFDIIVDNWEFSTDAVGLAFHVKVHEMQYKHEIRNGDRVNNPEDGIEVEDPEAPRTERTHNTQRYGIEFSDKDNRIAYFAWTPEADVFDAEDNYIETITCVATAASYGHEERFGEGHRFGIDFINLFLVYPNYGDNNKLVHDPVVGVDDTQRTSASWISLATLPIIAFAIIAIQRRRK